MLSGVNVCFFIDSRSNATAGRKMNITNLQNRHYLRRINIIFFAVKLLKYPTSLVNFSVCTANSRVGERIMARAPLAECSCNFSNIGTTNAAVLPLPVRAMATTSLPSRITGMACHNHVSCYSQKLWQWHSMEKIRNNDAQNMHAWFRFCFKAHSTTVSVFLYGYIVPGIKILGTE